MIVASLIINLILSFILVIHTDSIYPDFLPILIIILSISWTLSLVGSVLYQFNHNKFALVAARIGFILYIPISFIGLYGLAKLAEKESLRKFQERKEVLKNRQSEADSD